MSTSQPQPHHINRPASVASVTSSSSDPSTKSKASSSSISNSLKYKDSQEFLAPFDVKPRILTEISHNKRSDFDLKHKTRIIPKAHGQGFINWCREMVLPVGYPHTVHACYGRVHLFQFIETFAAQLNTVITSQALLSALELSTAFPVAVQWVITNGFGEVGKLMIIQQFAYLFDSYPKTGKIIGEFCCILGNTSHMLTLFFPQYYLLLASFGYCLYGIYCSIWSATHSILNTHLAKKQNNIGDLNAKDDSQVSLAHLMGLLGGVGLLCISDSLFYLSAVFIGFSAIQVIMTYCLVSSAKYAVMNFERMRLTSHNLVHNNKTVNCTSLKDSEDWTGEFHSISGLPNIRIAKNVKDTWKDDWLADRLSILKDERYVLVEVEANHAKAPVFKILLREGGSGKDIFKAVLHATKWASIEGGSVFLDDFQEAYTWTNENFPLFMDELKEQNWKLDILVFTDNGIRVGWQQPHPSDPAASSTSSSSGI